MSITLGSITNSGNQGNAQEVIINHTSAANTKLVVLIVTAYDSSAADSVVTNVFYGNYTGCTQRKRHRSGNATIEIWSWHKPNIGVSTEYRVYFAGTNTDAQLTVVDLCSTTAAVISFDSSNGTDNTGTSHAITINPANVNSIALGAIVDVQSAVIALSVTSGYGTEISGSEADMGSQVVGCAYRASSGTTAEIRWTKSASATSYAAICTFYELFPPTIALNTPTNNATEVSLTPDLVFTGSDAESEVLEYRVQVDTVDTFDSSVETNVFLYGTLSPSLSGTGIYAPERSYGQAFRIANLSKLTSVTIKGSPVGPITGFLYAKLYLGVGIFGTDCVPGGAPVAISDGYDVTQLIPGYNTIEITFSGTQQYMLQPNVPYVIVAHYDDAVYPDYIAVQQTDVALDGNAVQGGPIQGWNFHNYDNLLYLKGTIYRTLIDKKSTTDSGFTDVTNGADTHPFAAGDQIKYTVGSGVLSFSTDYYWRVFVTDVNGYFSVSSGQKFTTLAGTWAAKNLKAYIGGTWVAKPLKAYIGGTWTTKSVKKIG